jgi:hypothetical protein
MRAGSTQLVSGTLLDDHWILMPVFSDTGLMPTVQTRQLRKP